MINRVVLIGRLTRDPQATTLSSGAMVVNFSIALNRNYKKDEVDYIDCAAWNKLGELVAQYVKKGSLVGIDGRLQQDRYTSKNGENRSRLFVVCSDVRFLDSRSTSENKTSEEAMFKDKQESTNTENMIEVKDDDLPW